MCEYCEKISCDNYDDFLMFKDIENKGKNGETWHRMAIAYKDDEYYINSYQTETDIYVKINFCPMCGRDLRKEKP